MVFAKTGNKSTDLFISLQWDNFYDWNIPYTWYVDNNNNPDLYLCDLI